MACSAGGSGVGGLSLLPPRAERVASGGDYGTADPRHGRVLSERRQESKLLSTFRARPVAVLMSLVSVCIIAEEPNCK